MSINYVSLQDLSKKLITDNGGDVVLIKRTANTYNPSTNSITVSESNISCKAIKFNYRSKDIDNETIQKDDIKLLLDSSNISEKITLDDLIEISNEKWNIIKIREIQPSDLTIYYELQIRK